MNRYLRRLSLLAVITCAMHPIYAQTPPDAGSLRQEIEKTRPAPEPKAVPPTTTAPTSKPAITASDATVVVHAFHFGGNTLLTDQVLEQIVAPYLNRPIQFSELQSALSAVSDTYRKNGWIVRVYLPLQDITHGVVNVVVVEAVFGETRMVDSAPKRIAFEKLAPMISAEQKQGKPLSAAALDRALLLMNDLPGIAVSGNLTPGTKDRSTDLLLKVDDTALVTGEVAVDNAGSQFTGENRVIGTAFVNSALGLGDQLVATGLYAKGTDYLQLAATLPVGKRGWRAGLHGSYLSYQLSDTAFSALDAKGNSSSVGLDATYPLIRAHDKNLSIGFTYDEARYDNETGGTPTTKYKVDVLSTSLTGYRFDGWRGGGVNRLGLTLGVGKVNLDGSPNESADAATTQTNGNFEKLRFVVGRQQHLSKSITLNASLSGQLASRNLSSSEKYNLGGSTGVRAYSSTDGDGDQALQANIDATMRLPFNLNLTAFYDWGQITINHSNDFIGAAALNKYSLQGAGLSLDWQSETRFRAKVTWAHRIGTDPFATATSTSQDSSLKDNRLWLQASMSF